MSSTCSVCICGCGGAGGTTITGRSAGAVTAGGVAGTVPGTTTVSDVLMVTWLANASVLSRPSVAHPATTVATISGLLIVIASSCLEGPITGACTRRPGRIGGPRGARASRDETHGPCHWVTMARRLRQRVVAARRGDASAPVSPDAEERTAEDGIPGPVDLTGVRISTDRIADWGRAEPAGRGYRAD